MNTSMTPYRHTEVVRVTECESCARNNVKREIARMRVASVKAVSKETGRTAFTYAPWMAATLKTMHWTVSEHPKAPIWAVLFLLSLGLVLGCLGVAAGKRIWRAREVD